MVDKNIHSDNIHQDMYNPDRLNINLAKAVAKKSDDRSTKVGCIIVDSNNSVLVVSANKFPEGVDSQKEDRHERPKKYLYTEHAERNAIYQAAKSGISLFEATMYLPWFPCADCARAIIQSGIKRLVCFRPDLVLDHKWADSMSAAIEMLAESGVEITYHTQAQDNQNSAIDRWDKNGAFDDKPKPRTA